MTWSSTWSRAQMRAVDHVHDYDHVHDHDHGVD
jgi:hypothetical protein